MEIQSLSIAVPLHGCINACPFCVSRMHSMDYENRIGKYGDLQVRDYKNRMLFARKNGCNTAIITGTGEALQNVEFVRRFGQWNQELGDNRFLWLELQSTGVLLEDNLDMLYEQVGITTIALSVSDIFDSANNARVVYMPSKYAVDLDDLCAKRRSQYQEGFRMTARMGRSVKRQLGQRWPPLSQPNHNPTAKE